MKFRVVPKTSWMTDPAFRPLLDQEMSKEIEMRVQERILAVNPAANPATLAGSFEVHPVGGGMFEVIKRGTSSEFSTPQVAPTRMAAMGAGAPQKTLAGEDPIKAGIDDAMRQLPVVIGRVRDAIERRSGVEPSGSLQSVAAP